MPGVRVASGARLHRCIIDKNVHVPAGLPLRGRRRTPTLSSSSAPTSGVIVVEKDHVLG